MIAQIVEARPLEHPDVRCFQYHGRSRTCLERLLRDVQAAPFHPLPEKKQLEFSGRVALGLSPIGS